MEKKILTDPKVNPDNDILEGVLDKKYKIYQEFVSIINDLNLKLEWNYYKDGSSGNIVEKSKKWYTA